LVQKLWWPFWGFFGTRLMTTKKTILKIVSFRFFWWWWCLSTRRRQLGGGGCSGGASVAQLLFRTPGTLCYRILNSRSYTP
jgi:hypothetical protein